MMESVFEKSDMNRMIEIQSIPIYLGKCPAHGDFLKSKQHEGLISLLDQWLTESLSIVMKSSSFEKNYNDMNPLDFLIVNPLASQILVANLVPSKDSCGRQFPLLIGHVMYSNRSKSELGYIPLRYKSVFSQLYQMNRMLVVSEDSKLVFNKLNQFQRPLSTIMFEDIQSFYDQHTILSISKIMNIEVHKFVHSMLGLGLLLQPIAKHGIEKLTKILTLPIQNSHFCYEIASFWVDLIDQFIQGMNSELFIGILHKKQPILFFGFKGVDIEALGHIFKNELDTEHWVSLIDIDWIKPYFAKNPTFDALERQLCDDQINLKEAIQLFKETFIGC